MTPKEIITDDEIERVHANANFGSQSKRDVVDNALLKAACKLHNGSTANYILEAHGLIDTAYRRRPKLTDLGREYLYAICKPALATQHAIRTAVEDIGAGGCVSTFDTRSPMLQKQQEGSGG
jgi:hypothetical protein